MAKATVAEDLAKEVGGLTRDAGAFVAGIAFRDLPEEAVRIARTGFIDCIGTMIAGSVEPAPRLLRQVLGVDGRAGEASLYLGRERAPAPEAAWINGTAGHALDYDDVAQRGHPSTVLVPVLLAEGETLGSSGREVIAAYAAGYELWAELAGRETDRHHEKGWHPTGIFGAIAAAAAAAALRRLDPLRAAYAIAIGASQSSGIGANFGTMTKPFHAGRAAHSGVIAARLAAAGFTASPDALEHPLGFLSAVSPAGRVDRETPARGLGVSWRLAEDGLSIKKYPCCYCTHRAIDAMLGLAAAHPLAAGDIARITVSLSKAHALILRNHRPGTGLAAKFSMEFAMAAAVIAGRVGLAELSDDSVRRRDVQELIARVVLEPNENYDEESLGGAVYDQVFVHLKDGVVLQSEQVRRARGHAERPLASEELWQKFAGCLATVNSGHDAAKLFARLERLEELASVRELAG
ncbi:MAG: MmgE/PrpD family protein [Alphaproteobacteria bacterium]